MKKYITVIALFCLTAYSSAAQEFRGLDKSPMDRAYLPDNFAHDRNPGESAIIKVVYSRPQKNGRMVFGGMIKYNELWRLGANEATEIMVYKDINIGSKMLKAGTYSMYAIPAKDKWTIIFNSDLDYWGHYSYNKEHDVLRIETPVFETKELVEALSIQFENLEEGKAVMYIAWDMTKVEVAVGY